MSAWSHQPISSLGTVITGSTPKTSEEHFYGGDIPFVTPAELDQTDPIMNAARTLSETGSQESRLLPEGTVMVCCIGSLGKVGIAGRTVASNQQINSVIFDPKIIWPRFGFYACRLLKPRLEALAPATTVPIVNKSKFGRLEIPVPPLEEQKRIADILDRAEALRAKRKAALDQLNELTQSIFYDMFGDPIFNPQKFPRIQLMNLCSSADDIKCGPFGTQLGKDEYTTEGVPLWGIKHVNALFKLPTQEFLEAKTAKRLIQYSIEPSDIVMTRKGTIGNCAVYPESHPLGIMHSDLLRLRTNLQACDPIFLSHQLHYSRDVERQLALISGGAVMPGINVTKLKSLEVLTPPLDLQKEFAHRIEAVEKIKATHRASLAELDELFASLQYRAFRGEL